MWKGVWWCIVRLQGPIRWLLLQVRVSFIRESLLWERNTDMEKDTVVQPTLTALPQRDAKTDARMERQPPESNPQRKIPHQQSAALLPPRLLANPFLVSPRRLPTRSPTQPVSLPPMAAVEPNSETLSVVTGPKETAAACTDTVVKQLLTAVRVASQETAPARLPSLPLPPAQLLLLRSRVALRWLADLVSPVCTLV
jgi:hypothetical protein